MTTRLRATFRCPFCSNRTTSTGIGKHLSKRHPEIGEQEFLAAMESSLRDGAARLEVSGARFKGTTGTKLLAEARKAGRRVQQIVSGGSPGLKKSRS